MLQCIPTKPRQETQRFLNLNREFKQLMQSEKEQSKKEKQRKKFLQPDAKKKEKSQVDFDRQVWISWFYPTASQC